MRARRRGRGGRRSRHRVRGRRPRLRRHAASARTRSSSASARAAPLAHMPAGMSFEEAAAVCDGAILALACLRKADLRKGQEHPRLRRLRIDRHRGGAAGQALRRPRHGRLQHEERRARALARRRRGDRLHAGGLHEERRDVRRHLRRGRQALVPALPTLAEAGRDLRRDRPRVHVARPAPRAADPVDRRQAGDARRSRSTRRRTSSSSRS